jgi:hypothetical protein
MTQLKVIGFGLGRTGTYSLKTAAKNLRSCRDSGTAFQGLSSNLSNDKHWKELTIFLK